MCMYAWTIGAEGLAVACNPYPVIYHTYISVLSLDFWFSITILLVGSAFKFRPHGSLVWSALSICAVLLVKREDRYNMEERG